MGGQKWSTDYKWKLNKVESDFLKQLSTNGFCVLGNKMYISKVNLLIRKNDLTFEYSISSEAKNSKKLFGCFMDYYKILKEVNDMRKLKELKMKE